MRIHCFQHVAFEGVGCVADWARAREHTLSATRWWVAGAAAPPPESYDWLVVAGGPMGVDDETAHPWLAAEKLAIEAALSAGRRVLGLCLGAQLIARVLGARVYANREPEIGWFPITRSRGAAANRIGALLPAEIEVLHWHGDTFDLPAGSIRLAENEVCRNQAFAWGERVLGLQFHLETTALSIEPILRQFHGRLPSAPHVQTEAQIVAEPTRFETINALMRTLLSHLESA